MIRTDDLQFQGLTLLQDTEEACFSEDATLLINFLRLRPGETAVDLGSGNGVIAILGQAKTGAAFTGVEKQESLCALARRSAQLNGQDIPFYCMDVLDAPVKLGAGTFSAAVMNPPYFSMAEQNRCASKAMARHGALGLLDDFLLAAFQLIKNRGKLFACYPADRLATLFVALRTHDLEPKRMKPVLPDKTGRPRRVLIEARKGGRPGLIWES